MQIAQELPLPRTITKGELARYFGVHLTTLRRRFLTREMIEEWGYDYEEYKLCKVMGLQLTAKVFEHFEIEARSWHTVINPHL